MGTASKETREKGLQIFAEGKVRKDLDTDRRTHFLVQGKTEQHSVIFDKQKNEYSCDCRFFALTQKPCSHVYAAELSMKNKNEDKD